MAGLVRYRTKPAGTSGRPVIGDDRVCLRVFRKEMGDAEV